jgi:hypothetical protein
LEDKNSLLFLSNFSVAAALVLKGMSNKETFTFAVIIVVTAFVLKGKNNYSTHLVLYILL